MRYKVALTVEENAPGFYGVFDTEDKSTGFNGRLLGRSKAEYAAQLAAQSREDVRHPGKFEGEAPYVPFFWSVYLDGGADRDNGNTLGFDVTADDRALFPELKGRHTVNLVETETGFVCEV